MSDSLQPWACQAPLSSTISWSLLKFMSIELVMLSNHLILFHSLLLLPSIFPSIKVFSSESALCIRWLKYRSFSISPSNRYSGSISLRIDWFDILVVQGTLKSLFQPGSLKASILQSSVFFTFQLSHLYVTTGKNLTLTVRTFVAKWCICFLISYLDLTVFLPRSKLLLLSWLQSQSTVILEPMKMKFVISSHFSPSICHEEMGPDAMISVFWMLSFKLGFLLSSFTFIKRIFSSSLLSVIRVVSTAYLRLLIFLPEIFTPAYDSSSLAFCLMYCAYKLNKQGDNMQLCHTSFPILNLSLFPCLAISI